MQQQPINIYNKPDWKDYPAPQVTVNVPEQPAPIINVNVPAPVVNVNVPEQAAPIVKVAIPKQETPIVNVNIPPKPQVKPIKAKIVRDAKGNITGIEEK